MIMDKPIRILQVVRKMDMGGVQSMIMNYYKSIDRNNVQFDFLVQGNDDGFYDREIIAMGGVIHKISHIGNLFSYYKDFNEILCNNDYKIIHIHENFRNIHGLILAFKNGVPCRISHSHNSYPEPSFTRRLFKKIISFFINRLSTHKYACSYIAADWLYGKKQKKNSDISIINNAIETKKFKFDKKSRLIKRDELNLTDKIVIGHIGNFSLQKNHEFLIDIFNEIHLLENKAHLVLVGEGELLEKYKKKVDLLGLNEKVSFLGKRDDANQLLHAFDLFLFPSLYEGLPVVVVEAQASGLQCVISDEISKEITITNLVNFINLKRSTQQWAQLVIEKLDSSQRNDMEEYIKKNGYDIVQESQKLETKYIKMFYDNEGVCN